MWVYHISLLFPLSFPTVDYATAHCPFRVETSDQHLFHHFTLTLFILPWQQTCWISKIGWLRLRWDRWLMIRDGIICHVYKLWNQNLLCIKRVVT